MNSTLLEKVWCMLFKVSISKSLWTEVLVYAYHLVNWLSSSAIGGKTPLEIWSEKVTQDYDLLWVFECPAYYHIKEDKLEPKARKGVFLGFKKGVKSYQIWDPNDMKFILTRDVTFDEASKVKPTDSQ